MEKTICRASHETEQSLHGKLNLSPKEFKESFESLVRAGLVKKDKHGKLSAAPSGLRYQNLTSAQRYILYAILGLSLSDPRHPAIATAPDILGGRPHLAGTRIAVEDISGLYEAGMGTKEILEAFPHLTHFDVDHALKFYFDHSDAPYAKTVSR